MNAVERYETVMERIANILRGMSIDPAIPGIQRAILLDTANVVDDFIERERDIREVS